GTEDRGGHIDGPVRQSHGERVGARPLLLGRSPREHAGRRVDRGARGRADQAKRQDVGGQVWVSRGGRERVRHLLVDGRGGWHSREGRREVHPVQRNGEGGGRVWRAVPHAGQGR